MAVQGQQPGLLDGLLQAVLQIGIDDDDLAQPPGVIALQQDGADLAGAVEGGVLGGVEEAALDGDVLLLEPAAAVFPDHIQLYIRVLLHHGLGPADDVLVVRPGKALVGGDH